MTQIPKPEPGTYPEYFNNYISKINGENLLEQMLTVHYDTIDLITSVDLETQFHSYAPGKWNMRQIIQHLIDCERIFAYRALSIARNEAALLPGFDENSYVLNSRAIMRDMNDLAREFSVVRASTIELIKSFEENDFLKMGNANGKMVSVTAIVYAILGHEIHHMQIVQEKYLS